MHPYSCTCCKYWYRCVIHHHTRPILSSSPVLTPKPSFNQHPGFWKHFSTYNMMAICVHEVQYIIHQNGHICICSITLNQLFRGLLKFHPELEHTLTFFDDNSCYHLNFLVGFHELISTICLFSLLWQPIQERSALASLWCYSTLRETKLIISIGLKKLQACLSN